MSRKWAVRMAWAGLPTVFMGLVLAAFTPNDMDPWLRLGIFLPPFIGGMAMGLAGLFRVDTIDQRAHRERLEREREKRLTELLD